MAKLDSDVKTIEKLIALMKENDLVELEIAHGDETFRLKRQQELAAQSGPPLPLPGPLSIESTPAAPAEAPQESLAVIESPIVGTFYQAPSPDSKPYVEPGTHVTAQTVVCIIEAMKVMNEIKAETSGTITEIMVENGAAVEYGQALFRIQPD